MRDAFKPFIGDLGPQTSSGLLPTNVKAIHYEVELEPDLANGTLTGTSVVTLFVLEPTLIILLNCLEIEVISTEIIEQSGNVIKIPKVHYDVERETISILLRAAIAAGQTINVKQSFKGQMNHAITMAGFNRSQYRGFDGKEKWMGSTMNQPTGCRQIFPCIDEPAAKATFSFTLNVDKDLTCLGNMDVKSETVIQSSALTSPKKKVIFNRTPPMSSYLVAFVVGELNCIESTEYRVPIKIYAAPDQDIGKSHQALEFGVQAMIHLEQVFGTPYPLPKLDLISVPGHGGAMENWGCVIYDDKILLRDESNASAQDNYQTAYTVTHELAHQWFGNIVTNAWWDSLWLNEVSLNSHIHMPTSSVSVHQLK